MGDSYLILSFLGVLALSAVHLFSRYLRFLDGPPRNRFLSVAAGISVSYVIMRLLPGVSEGQRIISEKVSPDFFHQGQGQNLAYLVVLLSFVFFYGMQEFAIHSKERGGKVVGESKPAPNVYKIHITTYSILNLLIGYLLLDLLKEGIMAFAFYVLAMFLKFIVNDHALHKLHQEYYGQTGRWVLFFAVTLGWLLSLTLKNSETVVGLVKAFIAGGALLNVLKEELPEGKENDFVAFATSGLGFAFVLLFLL